MTDNKLTDKEIIKGIECCFSRTYKCCENRDCPYFYKTETYSQCRTQLEKDTINLINRLQEKNERLERENKHYAELEQGCYVTGYKNIKAEAYKEFAAKLHEELRIYGIKDKFNKSVFLNVVDKAKKELVGDK